MTKPLLIGISAFLLWSAGSGYWYMCKIKGACWGETVGDSSVRAERSVSGSSSVSTESDLSTGLSLNSSSEPDSGMVEDVDSVVNADSETEMAPTGTVDRDNANVNTTVAANLPSELSGKQTVQFAYIEPILYGRADFKKYLKAAVIWLVQHPQHKLHLTGYTDNVASTEENLKLGLARAAMAADLFRQSGVPESQLILDSRGEQSPVAANDSPEGRRKNRRVEMIIIE